MGSLLGHAASGLFFAGFAFIWMIYHAYCQVSMGCRGHMPSALSKHARRLPVFGMVFLLICCIALIIGENVHPVMKWRVVDEFGNWTPYAREWQHCTMAMFFGLYSVVNLCKHTCMPSAARYEMLFGALAFFVEGFIFIFHVVLPENYTQIEPLCHVLLLVPVFGCFFAFMGEAFTKKHLLKLAYIRIVCILQQGTWLVQTGYILYKSKWGDERKDHMYVTIYFGWHLFVNILLLIIVYNMTVLVVRRFRRGSSEDGTFGSSSKKEWDDDIGMDMMEETQPCLQE